MADGHVARGYWDDWGLLLLWASFLVGPLTVATDLLVGYALVKPVCFHDHAIVLRGLSVMALAVVGWGLFTAWRCLSRLRGAVLDGARVIDRSYFIAVMAIGMNVLAAVLILTAAAPRFFMHPCE